MIFLENRFSLSGSCKPARANVPARGVAKIRVRPRPRPATVRHADRAWGIGFASEMIAQEAIKPHMVHTRREASMTAYLISLALAGLVAIAVWEGLA
jgi:hypothetical protein